MRTKISRFTWPLVLATSLVTGTIARSAIYQDAEKLAAGTAYGASSFFDCVGVIDINTSAGPNGGSFVMIAPQWGLTAAHVMEPYSGATVTSATASFGATLINPLLTVSIDSWQVYPGYTYDTPVAHGVDLALVHFSSPVTDITPAQLYGGSLESVFVSVFAGYGKPGTAGNGIGIWDHVRRAGQNTIGDAYWPYADSQYMISMLDEAAYGGSQPIEWMGSPGDSGGASFLLDNGQLTLVGINSFVIRQGNYDIGSGTGTLNITLPDYRDWIVSQVPEPSSAVLLGGGFLLMLGCCLLRTKE